MIECVKYWCPGSMWGDGVNCFAMPQVGFIFILICEVNRPIRIDLESLLSTDIVKMNIVLISFVKTVSPDKVLDVLIMMNAILHIHVLMMQNALISLVDIHVAVKMVTVVTVYTATQHHVDLANLEPVVMTVQCCRIMLMMMVKAVTDVIQAWFKY